MSLPAHDVVVLAGGAGRRMGGVDKAELVIGGERLLDRVLAAVPGAERRVVVGPVRPSREPVAWCCEDPSGGGPACALAASMRFVHAPYAVVLAVDLPLVGAAVVAQLLAAAFGRDGAVGVDASGRDQPLLATYEVGALRTALADGGTLAGASMRSVVARLDVARIEVAEAAMDCDTWAEVAQAEIAVARAGGSP